MCSPILMDNKINIRLNVSCLLLQSTKVPPAKLEIRKTHIEDFDQCRPGEKKEGRGQYYQVKLL